MDAAKLREIFEKLDQALDHPTELLIRGGAAVLAHGLEQRVTIDIDVLPASRFIEADLRRACASAGLGFNPADNDFADIGKLKRLDPEDLADVTFLIQRFRLTEADLKESFDRLPARSKADPVVQDNLRFVVEDLL